MESVVEGRARNHRENDRLNVQHEAVKALMGGELVRAPIDLGKSNIRVLDSGTAQANWLLDLSKSTHPTAQLVGTDIAPEQFPDEKALPHGMSLQMQSIFDPWPSDWDGSFDLVHQRFVLAACESLEQAQEAVNQLASLAKPGGWVEIHEGNMMVIQEGPGHEAMSRFRDLAVGVWKSLGKMPDPGVNVAEWLQNAGLQGVKMEVQTLKIGAAAPDADQGEDALYLCLNMFDAITRIVSGKPALRSAGPSLLDESYVRMCRLGTNSNNFMVSLGKNGSPSEAELTALKSDLETELRQVGNEWRYYLAFGQRL